MKACGGRNGEVILIEVAPTVCLSINHNTLSTEALILIVYRHFHLDAVKIKMATTELTTSRSAVDVTAEVWLANNWNY